MQRITQRMHRASNIHARAFSTAAATGAAPHSVAPAATSPLSLSSSVPMRSGHLMPLLGFGTWRAESGLVGASVHAALEAGYRHFDGAAVYGNEAEVGAALRSWIESPATSASSSSSAVASTPRSRRAELFITNKLWNTFHDPRDVESALRRSLDLMQLEYFDLYLVHWPVSFQRTVDPVTGIDDLYPKQQPLPSPSHAHPAATHSHTRSTPRSTSRRSNRSQHMLFATPDIPLIDTWSSLVSMRRKGLIRDIGLSNCTSEQVAQLCDQISSPSSSSRSSCEDDRPSVNQVESHPMCAQHLMQSRLAKYGVQVSAYSPLGNIHVAPTPSAASTAAQTKSSLPSLSPLHHPLIISIAHSHGVTPAQVLLRWNLQLGRSVLPKSVRPERIRENANLFHFQLSEQDMRTIDQLNQPASQQRFLNPTSFKREPRKYFFTAFE